MKYIAGQFHTKLRRTAAILSACALLLIGTGAGVPPAEAAPEPTVSAGEDISGGAPAPDVTPEPPADTEPPAETAVPTDAPAETEPAEETPAPDTAPSGDDAEPDGADKPAGTDDSDLEASPEPPAETPVCRDGKILIYNARQLFLIGTDVPVTDGDCKADTVGAGQPVLAESGEPLTYSAAAGYILMSDIPLPEGEMWTLPPEFTGSFESGVLLPAGTDGDEPGPEEDAPPPVYDPDTDSIYLYNPVQLALAASETAGDEPVTDRDYLPGEVGAGALFYPLGETEPCLTYDPAHHYILSADFLLPTPPETGAGAEENGDADTGDLEADGLLDPDAPRSDKSDTATITIRQVWTDGAEGKSACPESTEVTLYRTLVDAEGSPVDETGAPVEEAVTLAVPEDDLLPSNPVVLTEADSEEAAVWQTVIEDLPAGLADEDGEPLCYYAYSVEEPALDGYSTTVEETAEEKKQLDGTVSHEYVFTLYSASTAAAAESGSVLPFTGGGGGYGIVCFGVGLTLFGFGLRDGRRDEDDGPWYDDDMPEGEVYD